ncbi:hypothetical protein HQQ80_03375 [Microbacteriaceae bacterium VKM Ac-2855]|nr:hypothetical protein [Microbacteriaceae bacterium VKM Ac-2855]
MRPEAFGGGQHVDAPAGFSVDDMVVEAAEQNSVVDGCLTASAPPGDVVGFGPGGWGGATLPGAAAAAGGEEAFLFHGEVAGRSSERVGLRAAAGDRDADLAEAAQPPHRRCRDGLLDVVEVGGPGRGFVGEVVGVDVGGDLRGRSDGGFGGAAGDDQRHCGVRGLLPARAHVCKDRAVIHVTVLGGVAVRIREPRLAGAGVRRERRFHRRRLFRGQREHERLESVLPAPPDAVALLERLLLRGLEPVGVQSCLPREGLDLDQVGGDPDPGQSTGGRCFTVGVGRRGEDRFFGDRELIRVDARSRRPEGGEEGVGRIRMQTPVTHRLPDSGEHGGHLLAQHPDTGEHALREPDAPPGGRF